MTKDKIFQELKSFTDRNGLNDISFKILSESANLIIHLSPYNIVARIAIYDSCNKIIQDSMVKEIKVANHLERKGVGVISSKISISSGPHNLSEHYFTLWKYEEKEEGKNMSPDIAIDCIEKLTRGLADYDGELPILGVWKRVNQSAQNLRSNDDPIIKRIVNDFDELNDHFLRIDSIDLVPSHGDAHSRNLFPTKSNWLWSDFEDASLMPKNWDWVSLIANMVLFKGLDHPIFLQVMNEKILLEERDNFLLVLRARVLMSIIGNFDYALRGLGDLEYAELQIKHYEKLINEIENYWILYDTRTNA
jgi:thiamine kinase-like enzyme